MTRVLRTELRRSAALGAGLVVLLAGAVLLHAAPGRWSGGWMPLVMTQREYLVLMIPLALAAGAWQGRRETRTGLGELLGSTPRPPRQQVLPVLGALGAAVAAGYLVVLAVTAPWTAGSTGYVPAAAFAVAAVGALAVVAAAWLGLAVGRLWTANAAGPVLAVAGLGWLMGVPLLLGHDWYGSVLSPMAGMSVFSDFDTVPGRLSAAQAGWLAAVAAAAFLLHAARSRRARAAALLPLAVAGAVAVVLAPAGGDLPGAIDPVARELVCSGDAPRVCVARAHAGLLPEVTPRAREALALLADLPGPPVDAREDTAVVSDAAYRPRPDPAGTALFTVGVGARGGLAHADTFVATTLERVLQNRGSCPDGVDVVTTSAAAWWLAGQEPVRDPLVREDGGDHERVLALWTALRELPRDEALARVRAVREQALACRDVTGLLTP
ncbi:hypothetical protein [Blastococcus sp. SYSU D00695]